MCGQQLKPNNALTSHMSAEDYYSLSFVQLHNGLIDEAINSLSRAIEGDPGNENYYVERATAHLLAGDRESAVADYETVRQNYIDQGGDDPRTLEYYRILIEMI